MVFKPYRPELRVEPDDLDTGEAALLVSVGPGVKLSIRVRFSAVGKVPLRLVSLAYLGREEGGRLKHLP